MGRFALTSIGLPTVAAESVDHPDEASIQIPTTGTEAEVSLALAVVEQPMAGAIAVSLW